jgi:lipooligosaccharide transport system ATP-binding protein
VPTSAPTPTPIAKTYKSGSKKPETKTSQAPRELIERYVEREVVELRLGDRNGGPSLDGLADHVEVLQDRVVIGTDDGDAVVDEVHARGLAPETVLVRRSTLEDVFLRLTGRSLID